MDRHGECCVVSREVGDHDAIAIEAEIEGAIRVVPNHRDIGATVRRARDDDLPIGLNGNGLPGVVAGDVREDLAVVAERMVQVPGRDGGCGRLDDDRKRREGERADGGGSERDPHQEQLPRIVGASGVAPEAISAAA